MNREERKRKILMTLSSNGAFTSLSMDRENFKEGAELLYQHLEHKVTVPTMAIFLAVRRLKIEHPETFKKYKEALDTAVNMAKKYRERNERQDNDSEPIETED